MNLLFQEKIWRLAFSDDVALTLKVMPSQANLIMEKRAKYLKLLANVNFMLELTDSIFTRDIEEFKNCISSVSYKEILLDVKLNDEDPKKAVQKYLLLKMKNNVYEKKGNIQNKRSRNKQRNTKNRH